MKGTLMGFPIVESAEPIIPVDAKIAFGSMDRFKNVPTIVPGLEIVRHGLEAKCVIQPGSPADVLIRENAARIERFSIQSQITAIQGTEHGS